MKITAIIRYDYNDKKDNYGNSISVIRDFYIFQKSFKPGGVR
jgi:hypothetical protein